MIERVLISTDFMPKKGGIQTLLAQRIKEFGSENLCVIAPKYPHVDDTYDTQNFTFKIIRTPYLDEQHSWFRKITLALYMMCVLGVTCLKYRPKVIECGQAFPFPPIAGFLKKIINLKVITWVHGNDLLESTKSPIIRQLALWGLSQSDKIIANSTYTRQIVTNLGLRKNKIEILKPTINGKVFYKAPVSENYVTKYNFQNKKIILSVGRLVERKGFDKVIESLPMIKKLHPNVVYFIVGEGPDRQRLESLARTLGVQGDVCFAGAVEDDELLSHYHLATLFVMVSRTIENKSSTEGLGLVYLEASACELPIVCGNEGGVTDIIHDSENGFVVNPHSVDDIAAAILKLLHDPVLCEKLGKCARARATQLPDWSFLSF